MSVRDDTRRKPLYSRLVDIGALTENPPEISVLGIYISAKSNYSDLEELDMHQSHKKALLLSLLNSRIMIEGLNSLAVLFNQSSPEKLEGVKCIR